MRSKLNFTGRKRIPKALVEIFVSAGRNGESEFKIELNLNQMDLPAETRVYLEAYYRSSVMRFDLGTIHHIQSPYSNKLDEIQSEVVFFRVKLVDESESVGKILAIADGISPGSNLQRASLLPVAYRDLGDRIWRLDLDGPEPVLEVNNTYRATIAIGEIVRKDPAFLTLVLPAVFRGILHHILFIDEIMDLDEDSWQGQWLKFASGFPGIKSLSNLPEDSRLNFSEYTDWIEDVVDSFSRYHHVKAEFEKWVGDF